MVNDATNPQILLHNNIWKRLEVLKKDLKNKPASTGVLDGHILVYSCIVYFALFVNNNLDKAVMQQMGRLPV